LYSRKSPKDIFGGKVADWPCLPELIAPMTTMAMATPFTSSMKRTYMVHLVWSPQDDMVNLWKFNNFNIKWDYRENTLLTNISSYNYANATDKLRRQNTEISKQIISEKEYRGLSPNFHIHVSVRDLYIPTIGLPILLEEI
jgi:hypothetical protein